MSASLFPNVVVRASAGTGKTFQLSNRYIGLAADGASPDTILATTFTRKAAGEILDRVLFRLAEAIADPGKLGALAVNIQDQSFDRARCLTVLRQLVHHIHRLRVSTLDSFFIQVAQSFALELGLPPGWQIAEEIDDIRLRTEAIRAVLDNEKTDDVLRLMHLLTKGEAARSVADQIRSLVNELYNFYVEAPAEAWSALPRRKALKPAEFQNAIVALESAPLPADKRFAKARDGDLENALTENWDNFLAKGLAAKILADQRQYYKKDIPDELVAAYVPLLKHAQAQIINRIADQTEATHGLLARFDDVYRRLKLRRRSLRFDDVTRLLADKLDEDELERVVYRLDARVAHLLLDEFQDTSPGQWHVLRPFAQRIVGKPKHQSFFCVGDVKQAIYGWRGGVAEIFEALEDELDGLAFDSLEKSWRSSPPVIETVNHIFQNLSANEVLARYPDAAAHWQKRFAQHSTARTELSGHCRLSVAPAAEEGTEQKVATWIHAAEQVAQMAHDAPGCSIGVLVRTNAAVARMIYELRRRNVDASEEGGNPLTDSPAVQLLMSLLTLADHPGDTTARFHVAGSPLAKPVRITNHRDDRAATRFSRETRRRLVDEGYGPVLRAWTELLAPACDRRDLNRLLQLVELAYAYEPMATTRPDDFVEFVENKRVESPTSARVRVMTVHQSKGLQFDICVLPELDSRLRGQSPQLVVGRAGPAQPVERICRYVNKDQQALLPQKFQEMFATYDRQQIEEALCVLYVALTRPIHALHMIVAPSKENEKSIPATPAGILRAVLTDGTRAEPHATLYENGDPAWTEHLSPAEIKAPTPEPIPLSIQLAPRKTTTGRGLETQSPSQLEGGPQVNLAERLQLDRSAAMDWGTAIHACFEQITWLEDGLPDDDLLHRQLQALRLPQTNIAAVIAKFRRALEKSEVRAVLSRSTYQPGLTPQVWNERTFVVRQQDTILRGTFDRLVILFDGDTPVRADIIDFKSDSLDPNDPIAITAKKDLYRPQLQAYRSAVQHLYGLSDDRIATRLVFVEPGMVLNV